MAHCVTYTKNQSLITHYIFARTENTVLERTPVPNFAAAGFNDCPQGGHMYLQRANSKLCFELPKIFRVTQNSLPTRGGAHLRSRCFYRAATPLERIRGTYVMSLWGQVKLKTNGREYRKKEVQSGEAREN